MSNRLSGTICPGAALIAAKVPVPALAGLLGSPRRPLAAGPPSRAPVSAPRRWAQPPPAQAGLSISSAPGRLVCPPSRASLEPRAPRRGAQQPPVHSTELASASQALRWPSLSTHAAPRAPPLTAQHPAARRPRAVVLRPMWPVTLLFSTACLHLLHILMLANSPSFP